MNEPIVEVQELHVAAAVDVANDPYGQRGCFAAWARFTADGSESVDALKAAEDAKRVVCVRCGPLEATGPIGRIELDGCRADVTVAVESLRYRA